MLNPRAKPFFPSYLRKKHLPNIEKSRDQIEAEIRILMDKHDETSSFINVLTYPAVKKFIDMGDIHSDLKMRLYATFGYLLFTESAQHICETVLKGQKGKTTDEIFAQKLRKEIVDCVIRSNVNNSKTYIRPYEVLLAIAKDWNNLQMMYTCLIPMGFASKYSSKKTERGQVLEFEQLRSILNSLDSHWRTDTYTHKFYSITIAFISNIIHHMDYRSNDDVMNLINYLHESPHVDFKINKKIYDILQYRVVILLSQKIDKYILERHRGKYFDFFGLLHAVEDLCSSYPKLFPLIYFEPVSLFTQ